ncbi:MAG TPA: cation transporter [Planctomycetes bacterium]|nr:cation transporter [Planctomycetota bacterium]
MGTAAYSRRPTAVSLCPVSDSNVDRIVERAFRAGLIGNVALAVAKLGVGWLVGSVALAADGWHSFADVLINVGAWVAHRFSKEGPDEDHHYGHAKLEAFAGFFVGIFLVAAGVSVIAGAFLPHAELEAGWRGAVALGVATVSIAVNLALAKIALAGSKAGRSSGLRALARDNTADALSSLLVLLAIAGSVAGLAWTEPLATVFIGGVIGWMGLRTGREGFDVLMDRSDPKVRGRLAAIVREVPGVREIQALRVRTAGGCTLVDLEISVDGDLTVRAGHEIAHAAEHAMTGADASVCEVHVHVNPVDSGSVLEPEPEPASDSWEDGSEGGA